MRAALDNLNSIESFEYQEEDLGFFELLERHLQLIKDLQDLRDDCLSYRYKRKIVESRGVGFLNAMDRVSERLDQIIDEYSEDVR